MRSQAHNNFINTSNGLCIFIFFFYIQSFQVSGRNPIVNIIFKQKVGRLSCEISLMCTSTRKKHYLAWNTWMKMVWAHTFITTIILVVIFTITTFFQAANLFSMILKSFRFLRSILFSIFGNKKKLREFPVLLFSPHMQQTL